MPILAFDIGGANIKAAHSDGTALVRSFELWRAPQRLGEELEAVERSMPPFERMAVTMTAELCDCFATKRDGVSHVLEAAAGLAGGRPVHVWLTEGRFATPQEAAQRPLACAASNWHALGSFVAGAWAPQVAMLIDVGSTTTDLMRLSGGKLCAAGLTDTQRLATGELLYLGVQRTPLMALGPTIEWSKGRHALMAERFATTQDLYVLTGQSAPRADCRETCDGRPLTRQAAAARVLRMIGADLEMFSEDDAVQLAEALAAEVRSRLAKAIEHIAAGRRIERVVVSGSGSFIAEEAVRLEVPSVKIDRLSDRIGERASTAACAHALVRLLGTS